MKSQMPRPVASDGLKNMHEPEPGTSRQPAILPEEEVFADTAPTCPQERKKIGVLSTSDPKFRIRVLMYFSAFGRGEWFQGVGLLLLTFPPSPFLGACVTACDTLPREHGCRRNVYTRYTFVTCHVSDTLFPGWVFLAQVWAGIGFCHPPPNCA